MDSVYHLIISELSNEKYIEKITDKYNKLKKIEKGNISPSFKFEDINGSLVSLEDLKGKLVYIDIWATWCMPCVKEIPSLKEMEEHFKGKDIYFVSICKDDSKENWKKMVDKKELGGIQLFAPESDIPFFNDYLVTGVPRFILLDKEGKIINANEKRPSNPDLINEIEEYLKDK